MEELKKLAEAAKKFDATEYANEYEFCGDGGDYTPKEGERYLIEDAVAGAVGPFIDAIPALIERVEAAEAENARLEDETWNSAVEMAASFIEGFQIVHTSSGDVVEPRGEGNRNGLAYADALRQALGRQP